MVSAHCLGRALPISLGKDRPPVILEQTEREKAKNISLFWLSSNLFPVDDNRHIYHSLPKLWIASDLLSYES